MKDTNERVANILLLLLLTIIGISLLVFSIVLAIFVGKMFLLIELPILIMIYFLVRDVRKHNERKDNQDKGRGLV